MFGFLIHSYHAKQKHIHGLGKKEFMQLNPKTKMAFLNENNNKKDNNIFFVTFSFYDTD